MKKTVLMTALLMLLVGCMGDKLNDKEKKIVGKWHVAKTEIKEESDEGYSGTFTMELTTDYRSNKTQTAEGFMRVRLNVDEDEYANTITLEYSISAKGTWSVEGNNIVEKMNEVNIEFSRASTITNNEDDEVYIEALKQYFDDFIPELRNEMLKKSREEIIKLTEDELTTKDDEGEEITYTRIE